MITNTPTLRRLLSFLAATWLAVPLFAAEPPVPAGSEAIPFRHTIIDGSPDLTRPAKAVGDINGDGFTDLVCGGSTGLFWYDYPTWTKHVIDPFRVENDFGFCVDMQVGDINGDGRPDVIVGDYKRTHTVLWYENPGSPAAASGPWKSHLLHTYTWHFNHDVELGDVNRDGRLDVLLRGPKGHTELLLQSTPDSWTTVMICQEPGEGSALADMDGDGDLDVVQANYWLECPADPIKGVWPKHPFTEGWADRIGVTVADMNRDGRPDVVMAPAESAGRLSWFEAPADPKAGLWKEHPICADVDYVHTFKVADMNRDGAPDIIFGEMHQASRKRVGVFLNQGDSEHWQFQLLGNGGTHNLRVADLGNDGDLDLIGANWSVWIPPLPGQKRTPTVQNPFEIWENLSAPQPASTAGRHRPMLDGPWRTLVEYPGNWLNDYTVFHAADQRWHAIGILGDDSKLTATSLFHSSGPDLHSLFKNHPPVLTEAPADPKLSPKKHAPHVVTKDGVLHMIYRRPGGTIMHVRGKNPFEWDGLGKEIFTERDARDTCIVRDGDRYIMYYCQSKEVDGVMRSCILARISPDLETWSDAVAVFVDTKIVVKHSLFENPHVIRRPEGWYLFASNRRDWLPGDNPRSPPPITILTVSFSKDPLFFGRGERTWFHEIDTRHDGATNPHAPEIVEADGRLWMVCVDRVKIPGRPGLTGRLEIAPLRWEPAP